jgi:Family of unknown function (DUF5522)
MKTTPSKNSPNYFLQEGEDFYYENGFMVFMEAYHLKRGYCCQSGCRHCPYGFMKEKERQDKL